MLVLSSCGYLSSGSWENDKQNWQRAYNTSVPDSIILIHSYYWKSTHWTLEQAMFFETEYNERIIKNFLSDSSLIKMNTADTTIITFFEKKPKWFVPKPYHHYSIWKGVKNNNDNFLLFLDQENRHLYWTDYQL